MHIDPTTRRDRAATTVDEAARPSRPPWRRLATAATLLICGGLFVWVVAHAELAAVRAAVARAGPRLALGLVPFGGVLALEALGWQRLYALVGRRVRLRALFGVRVASEAIFLSLPGGPAAVEALKPSMVCAATGVPAATTIATLPACKVMLMGAQSVYLVLGVAVAHDRLGQASLALFGARSTLTIALLISAGILAGASLGLHAVLSSGAVAKRTRHALERLPIPPLRRWLHDRDHAFAHTDAELTRLSASPVGALLLAGLPFFLGWLCEATDTWLMLHLLGAHPEPASVICLDASISVVRVLAVFVPGGLGVTDGGYLATLRAFDVVEDPSLAVAFVVAKRAKEVCWIVAGYSLVLLARSRMSRVAARALEARPERPATELGA